VPTSSVQQQSISISIVSHGHGAMLSALINRLSEFEEIGQIIITRNILESHTFKSTPQILLIDNTVPTGFATNQNAAFKHCPLPYFCALNPDIQLQGNPFPDLISAIEATEAAIAAPMVKNPVGMGEDSMRPFPTLRSLLAKAAGLKDDCYKVKEGQSLFFPEWVAGMFMLFRSDAFRELGGFDERFFLYYEDVDICARAWKAGMKVVACPSVSVVHDAQRTSHKNLRFMRWHVASIVRYFYKHWGRLPTVPQPR
jgi:GT2 family glycosyltransferase